VGALLGWHRPAAGRLLVDGQPLTPGKLEQLRRETAWVDPSVQVFNRSLLENLRYAGESGHGAYASVLETADLHSLLEALPEGLQTRLGEGGGLISGGEGQRVRFGRALLGHSARLVVLDEPFRGLDRNKRRGLLARATSWWKDATLFCITHDVSETLGFERVLVIDDGRLVEDGSPRDLAAREGSRYRALLDAERRVSRRIWGRSDWRRVRLDDGHLLENFAGVDLEDDETDVMVMSGRGRSS
jgi:ABC-type multidrug transport system fused ATPase/permease subunit